MIRTSNSYHATRLIILLLSLVFTAAACNNNVSQTPVMIINGHEIDVEIKDTPAARTQGLSNRDSMPENQGMLFVFDQPGIHRFWMKDMRFDLDFIWIREGKVVQVMENISKGSEEILTPSENVDMVLEVNAGWVAKKGIKFGDNANLTK